MANGKLARWLHLGHRWLGIALGLMVLLWFVSGLVMLFVTRPQLDEAERLAGLPALGTDSVRVSPAMAWQSLDLPGSPLAIRLNATDGKPTYRFLTPSGWLAVRADNPAPRPNFNGDDARRVVNPYLEHSHIVRIDAVNLDQWTLYRSFDSLRPFWLVELDDGREYYVSARTGEVALDTTRYERAWNWLGSVVHWVYITPLRQQGVLWRTIILWGSFIALLLALSGLWLGWQRLRIRQRYSARRITPYREAWKRWHHLLGLAGGLVVFTWLLSGWLSLAPFGLAASPEKIGISTGVAVATLSAIPEPLAETRELSWHMIGERIALIEKSASGSLVALGDEDRHALLSPNDIVQAIETGYAAPVAKLDWLDSPDRRYYPLRHYPRAFPVARVTLTDVDQTVLYVSPRSGHVELVANHHDFSHRWLYQGLHRFDFPVLVDIPSLRDITIIILSLLGFALCLTGCVLALRRVIPSREHPPDRSAPSA